MKPLDLSTLHPRRWQEARKRFALIAEYETRRTLGGPLQDHFRDCEGGYARLRKQAQKYRRDGDPNAFFTRRTSRKSRLACRLRLDPRTIDVIDALITANGPPSTAADIHRRAVNKCRRAKISQPTLEQVWNRMTHHGDRLPQVADRDALFVQTCLPAIPVQSGNDVVVPECIVAIALNTGEIIAWTMATPGLPAAVDRPFLEDLKERPERSVLTSSTTLTFKPLKTIGKEFKGRREHGLTLHDVVGRRIGLLDLLRSAPKKPAHLLKASYDHAVTADEARLAFGYAVDAHNASIYSSTGQ